MGQVLFPMQNDGAGTFYPTPNSICNSNPNLSPNAIQNDPIFPLTKLRYAVFIILFTYDVIDPRFPSIDPPFSRFFARFLESKCSDEIDPSWEGGWEIFALGNGRKQDRNSGFASIMLWNINESPKCRHSNVEIPSNVYEIACESKIWT